MMKENSNFRLLSLYINEKYILIKIIIENKRNNFISQSLKQLSSIYHDEVNQMLHLFIRISCCELSIKNNLFKIKMQKTNLLLHIYLI